MLILGIESSCDETAKRKRTVFFSGNSLWEFLD